MVSSSGCMLSTLKLSQSTLPTSQLDGTSQATPALFFLFRRGPSELCFGYFWGTLLSALAWARDRFRGIGP